MGLIYAEIELINGEDLVLARRNFIGEDEIKSMRVDMPVDTGCIYMHINENIQEQLQLSIIEQCKGQLANGSIVEYNVVGPVEVKFKIADAQSMPWFYRAITSLCWALSFWKIWMCWFTPTARNWLLIQTIRILRK